MPFDFSALPFFDNHTHKIDVANQERAPLDLAVALMHGYGDILPPDDKFGHSANLVNCSEQFAVHAMNTGVVKTILNLLSLRFECRCDPDEIFARRNSFTRSDMRGYADSLYKEARIIAQVVDDPAPMNDPSLDCFPRPILRLYQCDPRFFFLLKECSDYDAMRDRFLQDIRDALASGMVGVKCHVLEKNLSQPRYVSDEEARASFSRARAGVPEDVDRVYFALFGQMLLLSQDLNFTIHIHTGCSGNPGNGLVSNCDPFRLYPMLSEPRFFASRIVLLHLGFPDVRKTALMAHSFPNLWVDMSWTLPWCSINFTQCLEEALSIAPHSKLMFGSGQHQFPEVSWAAALIAKRSLSEVLEKAVSRRLLSREQAEDVAKMLCYKNAVRLYGIDHMLPDAFREERT